MTPRHNRTAELNRMPRAEAQKELYEGYFNLAVKALPSIVSEGLDKTHEFVYFRGDDSDDIKLPLDDAMVVARANDPEIVCAVTAHQHGYTYARRKPGVNSDDPFEYKPFPGIIGMRVRGLGKDVSDEQREQVKKIATEESEKRIQVVLRRHLFESVKFMTSPMVNEHKLGNFLELLSYYEPESHRHAAKLAKDIFDLNKDLIGKSGVTDLQMKRLKMAFDAVATNNPIVGGLKYQIVHDALHEDTLRPRSPRSRFIRRATGVLDSKATEALKQQYAGWENYLPQDTTGFNPALFVPAPSFGQKAVKKAIDESSALATAGIDKLSEVDPKKAAVRLTLGATLTGALGGMMANEAAAAPERPVTTFSLQAEVPQANTSVELNLENIAFVSAPTKAESSTYNARTAKAIESMIAAAHGNPTKIRIAKAMRDFMKLGEKPHVAAGFIGVFRVEATSEMLPGIEERTVAPQKGYGYGQWTGGRRHNLVRYAKSKGMNPDDPELQVMFTVHELHTSESKAYAEILQTTSPREAAKVISQFYERPNATALRRSLSKRMNYAQAAYDEFEHFYNAAPNTPAPAPHAHPKKAPAHNAHKVAPTVSAAQAISFDAFLGDDKGTSVAAQNVSFDTFLSSSATSSETAVVDKGADKAAIRASLDSILGEARITEASNAPAASETSPDDTAHNSRHVAAQVAAVALGDILAHPALAAPAHDKSDPAVSLPSMPQTQSIDSLPTTADTAPPSTATPNQAANPDVSPSNHLGTPATAEGGVTLGDASTSTVAASAVPALLTTAQPEVAPVASLGTSAPVETTTPAPNLVETTPADPTTGNVQATPASPPPATLTAEQTPAAPAATPSVTPPTPILNATPVAPAPAEKKADTPKPSAKSQEQKPEASKPKADESRKHETIMGEKVPNTWKGHVYYSQYDKRWAGDKYAAGGDGGTISTSGCGATSLAIVVANLADKSITPEDIAKYNMKHGFKAPYNGTSWAALTAVPKAFGLKAHRIHESVSEIKKITDAGGYVIVNGTDNDPQTPATRGGHIFVIRDVTAEGKLLVLDPAHFSKTMEAWDAKRDVFDASTIAVAVTK